METEKVVFAEDTMTVHRNLGNPIKVGKETLYNVESVTLLPGETFDYNELPPYQQNALLNDKIEGLKLLTPEEVEQRLAERDRILGLQKDTIDLSQ